MGSNLVDYIGKALFTTQEENLEYQLSSLLIHWESKI